jgi:hypothetical protein
MTTSDFYIFVIISPWKKTCPFIKTKSNFLHPRIMIEFGLLVLEKIFKIFQCIFTLSLLSPLGEGLSPSFE